jgi:hypothetical protein
VTEVSENQPDQARAGTRRFALDVRAERQVTALRSFAAWLTLAAGAWLMLLPYPLPRAFAAAGFVFAVLWLVRGARTRLRLRDPQAHYLELCPTGIALCEGGAPLQVPWSEVESIAIDHDRLHVVVVRKGGAGLDIEPQYQGLNLQELAETLAEGLTAALLRPEGSISPGALRSQDG